MNKYKNDAIAIDITIDLLLLFAISRYHQNTTIFENSVRKANITEEMMNLKKLNFILAICNSNK